VAAGDCLYNPVLLTAGTTYQEDFALSGATNVQNRYSVLGTGTFNGVSAIEVQLDVTVLGATPVPTTSRALLYDNIVGTDILQYGEKTTATVSAGGFSQTVTTTTVNTPAVRYPINAKVGDVITQTYDVRTTTAYSFAGAPAGLPVPAPTTTLRTETQVWKFVAVETITVPAGTFQTCRFNATTTTTQAGSSPTTDVSTGWVVASGPVRGLTAKVADASGAQVLEAKLLKVN
jgi:hypothetical protein